MYGPIWFSIYSGASLLFHQTQLRTRLWREDQERMLCAYQAPWLSRVLADCATALYPLLGA